jgi:hypothetical protein
MALAFFRQRSVIVFSAFFQGFSQRFEEQLAQVGCMSMHQRTDAHRWKRTGEEWTKKARKRAIQLIERLWLGSSSINAFIWPSSETMGNPLRVGGLEHSNFHRNAGNE